MPCHSALCCKGQGILLILIMFSLPVWHGIAPTGLNVLSIMFAGKSQFVASGVDQSLGPSLEPNAELLPQSLNGVVAQQGFFQFKASGVDQSLGTSSEPTAEVKHGYGAVAKQQPLPTPDALQSQPTQEQLPAAWHPPSRTSLASSRGGKQQHPTKLQRPPLPILPTVRPGPVPRMAIVSASFGGRNHPNWLPNYNPQVVKCVLYTDKPVKQASAWNVVLFPYHEHAQQLWPQLYSNGRHSYRNITSKSVRHVMAARFYKMLMFLLPELQGVELMLWCDADHLSNLCCFNSLFSRASSVLGEKALAMEKHPVWTVVRAEKGPAARSAKKSTNWTQAYADIEDAWKHQVDTGFLDESGLFNTDRFVLNLTCKTARSAFQEWWLEIQNYTFQDQISLPHIVQRHMVPHMALTAGRLLSILQPPTPKQEQLLQSSHRNAPLPAPSNATVEEALLLPVAPSGPVPQLAVVSARFGSSLKLGLRRHRRELVRCVFFADAQIQSEIAGNWTLTNFPYHVHAQRLWPELYSNGRRSWGNLHDEVLRAKMAISFYRMNAIRLPELQGAEIVLWCDANFVDSTGEIGFWYEHAAALLGDAPLAIERHSSHPEQLYTGQFVLRASLPTVRQALGEWWREAQKGIFAEQAVLPRVLRRHGLNVRVLNPGTFNALLGGNRPL